jgi:hypothetical protein
MERSIDNDSALRVMAMEHGSSIVSAIVDAFKDPSKPLGGEALRVYNELKEWEWLEDAPIMKSEFQTMYRKMIAMEKYRQLKWQRDHPPRDKPRSKWETVMGKASRR